MRQALRRLGGTGERLLTALFSGHGRPNYQQIARALGIPAGMHRTDPRAGPAGRPGRPGGMAIRDGAGRLVEVVQKLRGGTEAAIARAGGEIHGPD